MKWILAGFGVLWTILAFSLTSSGPDEGAFRVAKFVFPGFGILFTIFAIVVGGALDTGFGNVFRRLRETRPRGMDADEASPAKAGTMKCPSCGAGITDGSSVSPHGEARCEHCGQWFNING